jgi:hypothetical protein
MNTPRLALIATVASIAALTVPSVASAQTPSPSAAESVIDGSAARTDLNVGSSLYSVSNACGYYYACTLCSYYSCSTMAGPDRYSYYDGLRHGS